MAGDEICKRLALAASVAILVWAAAAASSRLAVSSGARSVQVRSPQLTVKAPRGFRRSGPHGFVKKEDNGYNFDVSLVSFVSRREVVSVAAEHLREAGSLNYDSLPQAKWPDPGFLARASGCAKLTLPIATAMPAESGMHWILEAGFDPNGSYAYEAALLVAPDHRHEATIEMITEVKSCDDPIAVEAARASLRNRIRVSQRLRLGAGKGVGMDHMSPP